MKIKRGRSSGYKMHPPLFLSLYTACEESQQAIKCSLIEIHAPLDCSIHSDHICICVFVKGIWTQKEKCFYHFSICIFVYSNCDPAGRPILESFKFTAATEPIKAVWISNGLSCFSLSLHKSQVVSTCYLPKVALFQGSIVSLMEAR